MGNYCKTCIYWGDPITGSQSVSAVCRSVNVEMDVQIEHLENDGENAVIFTSNYFGCVHHRDRPPVMIDLKREINKKD